MTWSFSNPNEFLICNILFAHLALEKLCLCTLIVKISLRSRLHTETSSLNNDQHWLITIQTQTSVLRCCYFPRGVRKMLGAKLVIFRANWSLHQIVNQSPQ